MSFLVAFSFLLSIFAASHVHLEAASLETLSQHDVDLSSHDHPHLHPHEISDDKDLGASAGKTDFHGLDHKHETLDLPDQFNSGELEFTLLDYPIDPEHLVAIFQDRIDRPPSNFLRS